MRSTFNCSTRREQVEINIQLSCFRAHRSVDNTNSDCKISFISI
uniref:Uncharacterized protein n=1 Tax=Arundo donax TaxID=35708 RepID=A0A0A9B9E8_ARUDO